MSQFHVTTFWKISKLNKNVSVIYCCATNHPKTRWGKSTTILLGVQILCDSNSNGLSLLHIVWVLIGENVNDWGLESSGGFFTHMSSDWDGMAYRMGSAGTVHQSVCTYGFGFSQHGIEFLEGAFSYQILQETKAVLAGFFSPFLGSPIASLQHTLLVISKSLQPSEVHWEGIYAPMKEWQGKVTLQ